ncbi:MAG: creatininase family protein [Bacillota bacterium]
MEKILWGDYTTYEMKEFIKKDPVVIIPVGAYEQHGPHLAINTDAVIAENICKAVVEKSQTPCVSLPPVWAGISEHHMKFSGSLTLKHSTMSAFLYDILDSLARHGIRKVLAVNSHGGNMIPLNEALTRASVVYGGTFALLTYWNMISKEISSLRKSEFGGISHGGEMETSLQLFFNPKNVRKDRIPPANNVKGSSYWSAEMFSSNKITMYRPYDQLSELGHIGDPAKGTVEFGKAVFELVVEKIIKLVDAIWKDVLLDENY